MISLPGGLRGKVYRSKELLRIASARARAHWFQFLGARIAPKCLLGKGSRLERPWRISMGTRCVLQERVWLNVGSTSAELEIGEYTFIGRDTEIEVAHSVRIGKGCLIAPGVFITDHNHETQRGLPMWQQPCISAPVVIGDDVWVSANAVILPGVTIGEGAIVAAGAVVNRDVPPNTIVGGVPAKPIRPREEAEVPAPGGENI